MLCCFFLDALGGDFPSKISCILVQVRAGTLIWIGTAQECEYSRRIAQHAAAEIGWLICINGERSPHRLRTLITFRVAVIDQGMP